jgi:hypothetical protein
MTLSNNDKSKRKNSKDDLEENLLGTKDKSYQSKKGA